MELVVTSNKELKLNAVKNGFSRVFENVLCEGVSVPDQVAAQPIGFEAGREGAWGRIRHLRKQFFSHPLSSRIAVSIENFITEVTPGSYFDFGCIALDDPHNQIKLETYSQCVAVPNKFVTQAKTATSDSFHLRSTGYEVTAGELIGKEMPHIPATDFHKRFCGTSREEILTTACQVLAGEYAREIIGKSTKEIPCRVYISRDQGTGSQFRLMQWNVLAQALMGESIVKPIKDRIPLFQREFCAYSPDIICLQEADLFYDVFSPFLSTQGYTGYFLPKINSPCLTKPDNNGPCGCALFYKETVFRFVKKYEFVLLDEDNRSSNQVLLVGELEHKESSQRITVAVTHLKAMPNMHKRRLAQSKDLINKLKGIHSNNVIISGDFNFDPTEASYQFMSQQCVIPPIKSVYGEVAEPEYTCQWVGEAGELDGRTVDYIWYSGDSLKVSGFYRTPNRVRAMLYVSYNPSDHWPLIVDFMLC